MNTNTKTQTSPISNNNDMPKHEYKIKYLENPFSSDDDIKIFNKCFFAEPDTQLNRELKIAKEKIKQLSKPN